MRRQKPCETLREQAAISIEGGGMKGPTEQMVQNLGLRADLLGLGRGCVSLFLRLGGGRISRL